MVSMKVLLSFGLSSRTPFVIAIFAALFVDFYVRADDLQSSTSVTSLTQNSTDSTAEESDVKYRRVRNNVIRYGAIYRGASNSSVRSARTFTRRPKASRNIKHRHSTKVDTTKLPIVLLPPVLTFKNNDVEIEKHDPFVINVVSELSQSTSPPTVTSPFSRDVQNNQEIQPVSNRPLVDEKIMAMTNFGVRMNGKSRGEVKFQTTLRPDRITASLNDYTPPPTVYPSVQKLRKLGKQSQRRRNKVRTTAAPYNTDLSAEQILPRENQYENVSTQKQDIVTQNQFYSTKSTVVNSDFLGGASETTTYPAYSDFTNSSLADVLNYDIQRTSPRTVYSLDATGPISSLSSNQYPSETTTLPNDSRYDANTPNNNYEGSDFLIDNPVSSPGSPTTIVDEYFSNVQEISSSFVPRTEINVATSKSQAVESPTTRTDEDNYELKDLIYPPLNILAPPYLEDVFHDHLGNIVPNATEYSEVSQQPEVTTPFTYVSESSYSNYIENIGPFEDRNATSFENTSQPFRESYDDNSLETASQNNNPAQQDECQNCSKNDTAAKLWENSFSPSDVKVLSEPDGLALINMMYENLLRVLNGGPDYYDLSEEPQKPSVERESALEVSTEASNLLAEESGDIRNTRQRSRAENYVQTEQRNFRRKEFYDKGVEKYESSAENQHLKKSRADRKASQLCHSKSLSYVADVSTGCKVFYVCTEYGIGEPMLCPNGTLFNQDYLVCDWWYNVECS